MQSAGKLSTDGVWEYFTCEPEGYSFESHSAGRVSHTYQKTCPWLYLFIYFFALGFKMSKLIRYW